MLLLHHPGLSAPASRGRPGGLPRARGSTILGVVLTAAALALALPAVTAVSAQAGPPTPATATAPALGPNVVVFDPSMPQADIQARVNAIWAQQMNNEMGTERYALLFMPGTYGSTAKPLIIPVGYYTEVAGLGRNPSDVTIVGAVNAWNPRGTGSLTVFWRSVSNLTIRVVPYSATIVPGMSGCFSNVDEWAVSQAAPMRRVDVQGAITFMPWCDGPNYASGGYIADSRLSGGAITNGSQQQFYVRDSVLGNPWSNGVWNQVFSGTTGAPATDFQNAGGTYTTLATTPVSKEKPYLFVDDAGVWSVFVPSVRTNSTGTTWADGPTSGTAIPLSQFFVASPGDSVSTINNALARGLNLILTPGVYDLSSSIDAKRDGTVVLGLGFATLTAVAGNPVLTTADVPGIDIAGITADAGAVNSPILMRIGTPNSNNGKANNVASNPVALQDVFFRIGGPHVGKATVALEVNTHGVILDHLWIWRADHGVAGSVGWTVNTADTGLVVNGNNVTATGLFVEHFQKYNVIWNGQGGTVIFFQNEVPYDPPDQSAYQHDGVLGWSSFKVADKVTTFQGYGMGSYIYTPVNPDIVVTSAFEAPVTPGVRFTSLLTINLSGPGTILHVINDTGAAVDTNHRSTASKVVTYP